MDVEKLRNKMACSRKTVESMAMYLGINPATLYRKLDGKSDFTRNEIVLVTAFLNLTNEDVFAIFFANELA